MTQLTYHKYMHTIELKFWDILIETMTRSKWVQPAIRLYKKVQRGNLTTQEKLVLVLAPMFFIFLGSSLSLGSYLLFH
jgi:hypothetical protein